jgi:hypothetical protein
MSEAAAPIGRPSDAALWTSIATTLRDVVLPGVDDPHHRQVVIQLIGLAVYARDRGPDPTGQRIGALADSLDELAGGGNAAVSRQWSAASSREPGAVLATTAEVLAAAVGAATPDERAAQDALRPVLVRHMAEDLAAEDVLLSAFRGRLPDD